VNLLGTAGNLRTQVTNNRSFSGDRNAMGTRLEAVREYASATAVHAASVSLLARDLAGLAEFGIQEAVRCLSAITVILALYSYFSPSMRDRGIAVSAV
jgi:hypothetical protein